METFELPEKVLVKISKELIDEFQYRFNKSGGEFKTVEEYIEFALTEILTEDKSEQAYTPEEEEEIK